jgi:transposase
MLEHGYAPHVRPRGEERQLKIRNPSYKVRRWVVESAMSWFTRFRKIYIRYEKKLRNFTALNHLAAAIIVLRKCDLIYR